jgi:hypothetical protein
MVSLTKPKLYMVEFKSKSTGTKSHRHPIFPEKAFVEDSLFPFKPRDNLIAEIDKHSLIITNAED